MCRLIWAIAVHICPKTYADHFSNFGRGSLKEHFSEIILKSGHWPRRRCCLMFFSIFSSGGHFVQPSGTILALLVEGHPGFHMHGPYTLKINLKLTITKAADRIIFFVYFSEKIRLDISSKLSP